MCAVMKTGMSICSLSGATHRGCTQLHMHPAGGRWPLFNTRHSPPPADSAGGVCGRSRLPLLHSCRHAPATTMPPQPPMAHIIHITFQSQYKRYSPMWQANNQLIVGPRWDSSKVSQKLQIRAIQAGANNQVMIKTQCLGALPRLPK